MIVSYKRQKLSLIDELIKTKSTRDNSDIKGLRSVKIIDIIPIGEHRIYNLNAHETHNYIADTIVTHNCAIGAVVGGSALAGGLYGKSNGKLRENILNMESENQRAINTMRFQNQADNIRNYNYGQMYAHRAANGGQIEIRDENRGKFTEAAKRHHMIVQQFAKKVLAKENAAKYSPQMRRRANFARNAAGWKHAEGGPLMNMFSGGGNTYIVKQGDTLSAIAKALTGNASNYERIAQYNGISNANMIRPGMSLNIPLMSDTIRSGGGLYSIADGDTLSEIAKANGISLGELLSSNPQISDPDRIAIGQKINLPQSHQMQHQKYGIPLVEGESVSVQPGASKASSAQVQGQNGYQPVERSIDEIFAIEEEYNKDTDENIINKWHERNKTDRYYIIDDKKNGKLKLCKNGKCIRSYDAIHGKNAGSDEMTKTNANGTIINMAGNMSTPAGYYISNRTNDYHDAPAFMRQTQDQKDKGMKDGIPSSIHARHIYKGANTNGCTGVSATDLKDMAKIIGNETDIETYILPADDRNRFKIRNNRIQFSSHDIHETPAYNTLVSNPISNINIDDEGLDKHQKQVVSQYAESLKENKKSIQDDLGINDDSYNRLAKAALGILGTESTFGQQNTALGNLLRAVRKAIFRNNSSPDIYSKYYTYGIDGDDNSIGLTQIRYKYLSDDVKRLYEKYGITKADLVDDPAKAAIATMLQLGDTYKRVGSIDKAIALYNSKPSYRNMVDNNASRFDIRQIYATGGTLLLPTSRNGNAAGWWHAYGGPVKKTDGASNSTSDSYIEEVSKKFEIPNPKFSRLEDQPKMYNPDDYKNGIDIDEFFRQLRWQLGVDWNEYKFDSFDEWVNKYNKYKKNNDYVGLINELNEISYKKPLPVLPERIRNNKTPTSEKSSLLEDWIVGQIYNNASSYKPDYASQFAIPWGGDENMINVGGYRVTPNILDSLAKYAGPNMANIPIEDALGLSAQETQFGRLPLYNIGLTSNYSNREMGNADVLRNFGILPAEALVRDFAYTANKVSNTVPPLFHAFNYFKSGKYNPGDPNHTSDVRRVGNVVFNSPAAQKWWEKEGKKWYYKGHQ